MKKVYALLFILLSALLLGGCRGNSPQISSSETTDVPADPPATTEAPTVPPTEPLCGHYIPLPAPEDGYTVQVEVIPLDGRKNTDNLSHTYEITTPPLNPTDTSPYVLCFSDGAHLPLSIPIWEETAVAYLKSLTELDFPSELTHLAGDGVYNEDVPGHWPWLLLDVSREDGQTDTYRICHNGDVVKIVNEDYGLLIENCADYYYCLTLYHSHLGQPYPTRFEVQNYYGQENPPVRYTTCFAGRDFQKTVVINGSGQNYFHSILFDVIGDDPADVRLLKSLPQDPEYFCVTETLEQGDLYIRRQAYIVKDLGLVWTSQYSTENTSTKVNGFSSLAVEYITFAYEPRIVRCAPLKMSYEEILDFVDQLPHTEGSCSSESL